MRTPAILGAFLCLTVCGFTQVAYTVTPDPDASVIHVSLKFAARKGLKTQVQIGNWGPGSYILRSAANGIKELSASNGYGTMLQAEKSDDNTWTIDDSATKSVKVSYDVAMNAASGIAHYSGPSTYLYVVGRTQEPCTVRFALPQDWKIAVGLDLANPQSDTYIADSYDTLADNPVTMGRFRLETYTVDGKPHLIAMRGIAKDAVDAKEIIRRCKFVTLSQRDFFGGLPYTKYVWHFDVGDRPDGGGGLEHLSSTQIGLPSGLGPGSMGLLAHEFFHLWNVKRIRSKPLGPFDYLVLPKTGALWWLEGVTDYYASLLLLRYGWNDEKYFYSDLLGNHESVKRNPARLEVSPYDASFRVGEAANGRGNSNGFRISYYNLGWLLGLCLDIEIRTQTRGKHSLDDVALALWNLCKDGKSGFAEDEIRKQCVRFGGPALGQFYDRWVMSPGDLPVEEQLKKVGLQIVRKEEKYPDLGFGTNPNVSERGIRVIVRSNGPAAEVFKSGDIIKAVNGSAIVGATSQELAASYSKLVKDIAVGKSISFLVKRGDEELTLSLAPTEGKRSFNVIEPIPGSAAAARNAWLYSGKKRITVTVP